MILSQNRRIDFKSERTYYSYLCSIQKLCSYTLILYLLLISFRVTFVSVLDVVLGEIVSFQPVVQYNQIYLFMIGIVAFLTQLQVLHLLRYHKTIAILGATLAHALWDLVSFAVVMGVIFFGFTSAVYLMYHDMPSYSTMSTAMGSQVCMSACNNISMTLLL